MMNKPDLDSLEQIECFINLFYQRVLEDELLASIFLEVAKIDLQVHIPIICAYWEKLLLGGKRYKRHTMNIHRAVAAKTLLEPKHFQRWLMLFLETLEQNYQGEHAEKAKKIAHHIAQNMERALLAA